MDKSWMHADIRSKAYELGVQRFLNFVVENLENTTHIHCPCVKCGNIRLFGVGMIRDHLYFNGIDQSYKIWTWHGEPWEWTTNASRNVEEDEQSRFSFLSEKLGMDDNNLGDIGFDLYEFANVIGDGDQPIYPGCRTYLVMSLKDIKLVQYVAMILLVTGLKMATNVLGIEIDYQSIIHIGGSVQLLMGKLNMPPEPLTGEKVIFRLKKKLKFFDLEYWKYLPVRHVLDVMHIEKNVYDSIIGTLLKIPGKNKDGIAAQLYLLNMRVKTDLQPEYG
ncbi:hypothetical protein L3X38_011403 [Prunus dulcis]|uniref:Transposase-associated domain-containing protein n=1 Tax=Prunus dulcis TaxID=3755 RepID=A0AAD4WJL3_PRUDU|nr:hypothetical protein L3X38_011403 [Prunus dulcis]